MLLALVRAIGLTIGVLLGMLLMLAVKAGSQVPEFPPEVQLLKDLPIVMRDGECFTNGLSATSAIPCEIRAHQGGLPGKIFYILFYRDGKLEAAQTFTLYPLPPDVLRELTPQEMKVVIRGMCSGEEFGTLPVRCEFLERPQPHLREKIYFVSGLLTKAERYYGVKPGKVLLEPPLKR